MPKGKIDFDEIQRFKYAMFLGVLVLCKSVFALGFKATGILFVVKDIVPEKKKTII